MKISEIFYSIEGEGIEIGRPEIFIRLAECNLRCKWCDTKYALTNGKEMEIEGILQEVKKYPCRSVSITGGEPLLQKKELLRLIKRLKELAYWIQINTNGTIFDKEIFSLVDLITMDCKCPSSGMKSKLLVLRKTKNLFGSKSQFKFIISNEEDYRYAKRIALVLLKGKMNIVFQPEWGNKRFTAKLAELVKKDGLHARIILQQHKIMWGKKRGI
jgi:7-carboxy-7-deazaguanine synthase